MNTPPIIPTMPSTPTPLLVTRTEETDSTVAEINRNAAIIFPNLQAVEVTEGYRFGYDNRRFWKFSVTVPKRTKTGRIRAGFQTITEESSDSLWAAYRAVVYKHFTMLYPDMVKA